MDRREFLGCCCSAALLAALGGLPRRAGAETAIEQWTRTVCDLCGLGEPVFLGAGDGSLLSVKGIPNSTIGFGRLCPRAQALWAASTGEKRALQPMVRRDPSTKGTLTGLEPVSWDEALAFASRGLEDVRGRLGPQGIGFLASDGETNETYHLLGNIARTLFRTDNVDTPAGLDAIHAYDACRDVFGIPGNAASLEDVDAADLLILIGGDLAESHPALFYRVLDSRRAGRSRVILMDPRKTLAAGVADLHLRPHPGRELSVVNALTAAAATEASSSVTDPPMNDGDVTGWWRRWLAGESEAVWPPRRRPLETASMSTGIRLRVLEELAASGISRNRAESVSRQWSDARAVVTIVSPGVLSAPTGKALALAVAQLHRATGRWGKPGQGALFLPKGANAAGVVAMGIAPGRLPGGRALKDSDHREQVARVWGTEPGRFPESLGLGALEWPAAVAAGRMGGFVVLRANPAVEFPAAERWREALRSAFVVSAATHVVTETEAFADVLLPLSLAAGESDGTMISLDRRYQLLEKAVSPPGEARAASQILLDLARSHSGDVERFSRYETGPHVAMEEWRHLSAGTPLDASGVSIDRLRRELGVKWPCLSSEDPGIERIGATTATELRSTVEGAALPNPTVPKPRSFVPTPVPQWLPTAGAEYPFLLMGGVLREHFHSRVRTGLTPELHYDAPVARIEMHPFDGSSLNLKDGQWVTLTSEWGQLSARIWLTDRSPRGLLFIPEHFGFLSDIQGGTETLKEPEGLFHLVTSDDVVGDSGAPAGWIVPVAVRPSRRRDMRKRGLRG